MSALPLAGIFVGGKSTRMGGQPKGLLAGPHGVPIVRHLIDVLTGVAEPVLIGRADAYRALLPDLPAVQDAPGIEGPLAGLLGLLRHANGRTAIALACDLPYLEAPLVLRLVSATVTADVLAPRVDDFWQPFFARYAPSTLPAAERAIDAGTRSFQRLFEVLRVEHFTLSEVEARQLRDWDAPSDVR